MNANQGLKRVEKRCNIGENVSVWQTKLVTLYCTVCDNSSTIAEVMQRQSNNFRPQFTDEECLTVYLWGIAQRRFEQKAIYNYTKNHLLNWFPKLPSYQAFSHRLGELSPAFQVLAETWMDQINSKGLDELSYVVDSCPIILAKQARSSRAKVAKEICNKSYNSSRKEYYYGVKLHVFADRHTGTLATPCAMMISRAADHDLTIAKKIMDECRPFRHGVLYADKAYVDSEWTKHLKEEYSVELQTPRKRRKEDSISSGDAYSTHISKLRQQIECFFNWLNANTNIQVASKVRSTKGLFTHVFGRFAAALFNRYFNS